MKRCPALGALGFLGVAACFAQMRIPANPQPDELLQINQCIEGFHLEVVLNDGQTLVLSSPKLWPETLIGVDGRSGTWTQIFHDRIVVFSPVPRSGAAFCMGDTLTPNHRTTSSQDQLSPKDLASVERWKPIDGERILAHSLIGAAAGIGAGVVLMGMAEGFFGNSPPADEVLPFFALLGTARGALGSMVPPPPRYQLPLSLVFPGVERSKPITLKLTSFPAERLDQVCIMWNGKRLWLSKSEVNVERDREYILLTVPERLLEDE